MGLMKISVEMLRDVQSILNLNQRELGVYIGVGTRTINNWMTGARECPMYVAEMALRLAESDAKAEEEGESLSGMFRWATVARKGLEGDEFLRVFGSKAEALRSADDDWRHFTDQEKKASTIEVALIHCQLSSTPRGEAFTWYENPETHMCDGDLYEVAKTYGE